jgi:hypothetical protein
MGVLPCVRLTSRVNNSNEEAGYLERAHFELRLSDPEATESPNLDLESR